MRGRTRRGRLSVLMGTLLLAAAAVLVAAPAAGAAEPTGKLRIGHLSPATGAVDATLVGPEGTASATQVLASGAGYGAVTDYVDLVPGRYSIAMRPHGSDPAAAAPLSAGLQVAPGTAQSLFFFDNGPGGEVRGQLVDDDLAAPAAGQGRVRVVQGAETAAPLQAVAVGGPRLATDLGYGAVTEYATVAARTWDVRMSSGPTTRAAQLPVGGGSVTTVVVTGGPDGALKATPLDDVAGLPVASPAAATTPATPAPVPQGGVPAGAGGTADGGPGVLPLVLVLIAAPLLVFGLSTASAVRRRG